jgi:threonine dehydrogenase-like Zn-dependent dehydrogenase
MQESPVNLELLTKPRSQKVTARHVMKAAVVTAPRTLEIQDVALPEPGPGQLRIRLEGCGVCASNIVPWEGPEWMTYPTQPGGLGHEGWGIVDAIGSDVAGVKAGDRVATLFTSSYAEYDVGDAEAVVRLPSSLDGLSFPGEPLGCAVNIFRRSDIRVGQTVAVVGIGFLGALLTRLATHAGARVIAISRRDFSLDLAQRMGAAETVAMEDHRAIVDRVRHLTGGKFCDRAIEATGKQWPLDLAGELAGEGGKLIVAGYHQDGPRQVNMQQWNWKGIDVINAHERQRRTYIQGIEDAIAAMETGVLTPNSLYTHRYPLSQLGDALEATRDHPDGFIKALVTF